MVEVNELIPRINRTPSTDKGKREMKVMRGLVAIGETVRYHLGSIDYISDKEIENETPLKDYRDPALV